MAEISIKDDLDVCITNTGPNPSGAEMLKQSQRTGWEPITFFIEKIWPCKVVCMI